ncbi:MAG: methylated-DNA--[protein]-cysteine S-methyltransferase [Deltaproteobacteria bacterium]|nr:methylated-DNA--[protein]-cysteine S-methyltransferase [Deltaproteobacteria bacterium]
MGRTTVFYDSKAFPLLGRVYVAATEKGLCALSLPGHPVESFFQKILSHFQPHFFTQLPDPFQDLYHQLDQYLVGRKMVFEIPLDLEGTPFQRQVWEALTAIPYGETRSYGEIARAIGRPKAGRAVGQANHNNPIPIVVPCHRVIGSRGDLVGYGSGLPLKEKLLALEREAVGMLDT